MKMSQVKMNLKTNAPVRVVEFQWVLESKKRTRSASQRNGKRKSESTNTAENGNREGTPQNDESEEPLHDPTEEDINNFKPGQTKPTPSPVWLLCRYDE